MTLYKMTDCNGRTRAGTVGETQWGPGVTVVAKGARTVPCTDGVVHAYRHPVLAVMMNPFHAEIADPRLWEADGVPVGDDGCKVWCKSLTTTAEIPVPVVTTEQRVRFGIAAALQVCHAPHFVAWATRWLDGTGRSAEAAWAACSALAWATTAGAAAEAAEAAVRAAAAEAWAAPEAAAWAAVAAARAARADSAIDLISLAEWAVSDKPAPAKWLKPKEVDHGH